MVCEVCNPAELTGLNPAMFVDRGLCLVMNLLVCNTLLFTLIVIFLLLLIIFLRLRGRV